jgi:hypothetical protein
LGALRFLNCAFRIQALGKTDFVRDFTENPYFLRLQRNTGERASPEMISAWKAEDEIESTRGSGRWSSVQNRIEKRHQQGVKLRKELGMQPKANEEISYLTVDCDFQDVPDFLPKTSWRRVPDKGLQRANAITKEVVEGPKTQKEAEEEARMEQQMAECLEFWKQHRVELTSKEDPPEWPKWTPRWEEIEYEKWKITPVKAYLDEICCSFNWNLRKNLEWQDFRFLVNSKLGHSRWVAMMAGVPWMGDVLSAGRIISPFPGQALTVLTLETLSHKQEKTLKKKRERWDQVVESQRDVSEWYLDYDIMEDFPDTPVIDEDGFYVLVEYSHNNRNRLIQLPRGTEWAYFESMISTDLGEDQWIAAFEQNGSLCSWEDRAITPRPGQLIRVFPLKDGERKVEQPMVGLIVRPEGVRVEEAPAGAVSGKVGGAATGTRVTRSAPAAEKCRVSNSFLKPGRRKKDIYFMIPLKSIQDYARRVRTGGMVVPLQEMQIGERQPLSLKGDQETNKLEEKMNESSARFRQAKLALEAWSTAEDFKERRGIAWVRSLGLSSPSPIRGVTSLPQEEIKCDKLELVSCSN